jgi:hypothetical protein
MGGARETGDSSGRVLTLLMMQFIAGVERAEENGQAISGGQQVAW